MLAVDYDVLLVIHYDGAALNAEGRKVHHEIVCSHPDFRESPGRLTSDILLYLRCWIIPIKTDEAPA
jgi:hypothetical protein